MFGRGPAHDARRREYHVAYLAFLGLTVADMGAWRESRAERERVEDWLAVVEDHDWGGRRRSVVRLANVGANLSARTGGDFQLSQRLGALYTGLSAKTVGATFRRLKQEGFVARTRAGISYVDRGTGEIRRRGATWSLVVQPTAIPRSGTSLRLYCGTLEALPGTGLDLSLPGALFESVTALAPAGSGGLTVREWADLTHLTTNTLTRSDRGHIVRLLARGLIVEVDGSRSLSRRRYAVNPEGVRACVEATLPLAERRSARMRAEWDAHVATLARRARMSAQRADDAQVDVVWCAARVRAFLEMATDAHSVG
jgi:hypothetical protein